MKGAGTLALLVLLAVAAGLILVATRREPAPQQIAPERSPAELDVAAVIGLPFRESPPLDVVSPDILRDAVGAVLDDQFGPGGLTLRTRAYELLDLIPPGSNLRSEMIAAEAAGARGWFDPHRGRILIPTDFQEDDPHDRVALHGLLTRALLDQHAPITIGRLGDDEWIARRGIYQAIAATVESNLRAADPEPFRIPPAYETEREAIILGLPMFLHNLAQFHGTAGQARLFVETRVATGTRALTDFIREPPRSTFEILGGDPGAISPPHLPELDQSLLEESIGALGVQILLEWLDDFEQARTLALLWRGDRYRLYANPSGDNLLWICTWVSPDAAARAGEILTRGDLSRDPSSAEPRHRTVVVDATRTVLANCASAENLAALLEALAIPGSPPSPSP